MVCLTFTFYVTQSEQAITWKISNAAFPLLDKIQQGSAHALKALKIVHEKGSFSCDCILMIDEMYLQKSAQYQSGENEGVDKEGRLYKETVAFMVVGFKLSIPFVVQTIPEVTFNEQ